MESVFTPMVQLSFKICKLSFCFWLPMFVRVDTASTVRLRLDKRRRVIWPWYFEQFFILFLFGLGSVCFTFYKEYTSPVKTLPLLNIYILLWCGIIGLIEFLSIYIARDFHHEIVYGFNRLLETEMEIVKEIMAKIENETNVQISATFKNSAIIEILMVISPLSGLTMGVLGPAIIVWSDLDPFQPLVDFVFNLPSPYYRNINQIYISIMSRYIIGFICTVEVCHLLCYLFLILITTGLMAHSCLAKLGTGILSRRRTLTIYTRLRIIFCANQILVADGILLATIAGQVVTSFAICFSLKTWRALPFIFTLGFTCLALACLVATVLLLSIIGNGEKAETGFINGNRQQLFTGLGKGSLYYKIWMAQFNCKFWCGRLFIMGATTLLNYMQVLLNLVTNVLLLFN